jgi:putative peptide zinc metalloprotease protein
MRFVEGVTWRCSKRGLVVCSPGGAPLLIEHERAADVPELLSAATNPAELAQVLGDRPADHTLVADLIAERIVGDPDAPQDEDRVQAGVAVKRVTVTRSGIEFAGIERVAQVVHRVAILVVTSWVGRAVVLGIVIAGAVLLVQGRPHGPPVSGHPWMDATLGFVLGLSLSVAHEIAHAVTLVHYGRRPGRAGFGFYWGSICFYVDSTDGITLPRRARIINALAGLALDVVTASILLIVSAAAAPVLIVTVFWRIAILQLLAVIDNGLPILEVDGHVALTDLLDEPDLAPRSREALGRRLRGIKQMETPRWLAAYGAFSLFGGFALLGLGLWVWWIAAGDLVRSLWHGNWVEILLAGYLVIPFVLAAVLSTVGLILELVAKPTESSPASSQP